MSQSRTKKYQKLKAVCAAEGKKCPVTEDEFQMLSNEKFAKVLDILSAYPDDPKDEDLTVKPIELSKDKFGSVPSNIVKQQEFKTMNNNTNDFWSRMQRARELAARDSKEMTFKHALNPNATSNLTADEQSQFKADRAYLDGRSSDMFSAAPAPEVKPDPLEVEPLLEAMSAEQRTAYELSRTKAIRVMQSTDQPAPKIKQPTEQDLKFAKSQAIFSAKPKKEISPEMKARLIQMGYMRP